MLPSSLLSTLFLMFTMNSMLSSPKPLRSSMKNLHLFQLTASSLFFIIDTSITTFCSLSAKIITTPIGLPFTSSRFWSLQCGREALWIVCYHWSILFTLIWEGQVRTERNAQDAKCRKETFNALQLPGKVPWNKPSDLSNSSELISKLWQFFYVRGTLTSVWHGICWNQPFAHTYHRLDRSQM